MDSKNVVIKWGLIGAFVSIIFGILSFLLDMTDSKIMQYIGVIVMLASIILGLFEYRDKVNGGFAGFKELLKNGILIGLIIAAVSAVWSFLYFTVLDTEFISRTLLQAEIEMEDKGLSEKDIKMAMEMTKKFMTPLYMSIMGFFSTFVLGGVVSLVSALILKREQPIASIEETEE